MQMCCVAYTYHRKQPCATLIVKFMHSVASTSECCIGNRMLEVLFPIVDALAICEFVHKFTVVFIVTTDIFMHFKQFLFVISSIHAVL